MRKDLQTIRREVRRDFNTIRRELRTNRREVIRIIKKKFETPIPKTHIVSTISVNH